MTFYPTETGTEDLIHPKTIRSYFENTSSGCPAITTTVHVAGVEDRKVSEYLSYDQSDDKMHLD